MIRSFHYNTCCVNYSIKKLKLDAFQIEKFKINYLMNEYLGSQKYAKGSKLQFHVMTMAMTPP